MPDGAEQGIIKGVYLLKAGASAKGPRVQLMGSGTILREVMAAADLLREDFKVNADIWSATSFNELRRDGMSAERWSLLHPTKPRRKSYLETALEGHAGPVVAATDYMRAFAEQVRSQIPRRYVVLGTDGFGRSDYRVKLRRFFEVNRYYVAVAALKALADDGEIKAEVVDQAIAKYKLDRSVLIPGPSEGRDTGSLPRIAQDQHSNRGHRMGAVTEVKVPDIGDFKDVPIIEVMVKAGDHVAAEDSLIALESDKATMEVPAPAAGTVKEVKVKVGDKVSEGRLILLLDSGAAISRRRRPRRRKCPCRPRRHPPAARAALPRCASRTSGTSKTCRSSRSS
jgi:biotin carboxyl carrier protein